LLGLVAILLLATWWIRRPRSLTDDALSALTSFSSNDADRLYAYGDPREIEMTHLTRDSFREIYRQIIWPAVSRFHSAEAPVANVYAHGSEACAYQNVADSGGYHGQWIQCVWASNAGPKLGLTDEILTAWKLQFWYGAGRRSGFKYIIEARRKGYAKDGPLLKRLGIPGMFDVKTGRVIPWTHLF
jgi:hypothetical protein